MNYSSYSHFDGHMMKRYPERRNILITLISVVFCILILPLSAKQANSGDLDAEVKAAYIYNFTKFINWPQEENLSATTPIRICVFGNDPIGDTLKDLSSREAKGHPLKVEKYTSNVSSIPRCHVLFISRSEEQQLPLILKHLSGSNVLTTSDIPRFSRKGGMIGFVTEGGRVKIEINLRTSQQAGLKISAKLLEVSRIIQ
jgi:hypothetical protein